MFENQMTYDFLPGIDSRAWEVFAKKAIAATMKAPGLVEFRAYRNMLGTPQVCSISVWKTLDDWVHFSQSAEWHQLETEMRTLVTNLHVGLWGPSPVVPEPLHPANR